MSESNSAESEQPDRPAKMTVEFLSSPQGLAILNRRPKAGCVRLFLLIWLVPWTGGCVAIVAAAIAQRSPAMFAFAVPFVTAWCVVAAILVWLQFGQEVFYLRNDQAVYLRTALIKLASRVVPRSEIQFFRECRSHHTENEQYIYGIEMVTSSRPLRFAFRLPPSERVWLIRQLNAFLGVEDVEARSGEPADMTDPDIAAMALTTSSAGADVSGKMQAEGHEGADEDEEEVEDNIHVLTLENTLQAPPSDSEWTLEEDFDGFGFRHKGRLKLAAFFPLLLVNLFWNGIVTLMFLGMMGYLPTDDPPKGREQMWGLLFLIPFALIGLVMLVALFFVMIAPAHRTEWTFERSRVVFQSRWWWVTFHRAWDVHQLSRIEMRGAGVPNPKLTDPALDETNRGSIANLVLIGEGGEPVCHIAGLTPGEALWMAHEILQRRRPWFGL